MNIRWGYSDDDKSVVSALENKLETVAWFNVLKKTAVQQLFINMFKLATHQERGKIILDEHWQHIRELQIGRV